MEDTGLLAFAVAVRSNPALAANLAELDLSSNGIGLQADGEVSAIDGGAAGGAEYVGTNAMAELACAWRDAPSVGLRWLNLSQNFLGDRGLVPLARDGLPSLLQLRFLELSCTNLQDRGVDALTMLLASTPACVRHLTTLGIYNQPKLNNGAATRLLVALADGAPALTHLHAGAINLGRTADTASDVATGAATTASACSSVGPTAVEQHLHSGANAEGIAAPIATSAAAVLRLVEAHADRLQFVDLRDNAPLPSAVLDRLAAAVHTRAGALIVKEPRDSWLDDEAPVDEPVDIFSHMEAWHVEGMAYNRIMWCQFVQTVWFIEGDDAGAELDQAPFVIQEPDGSMSHATAAEDATEDEAGDNRLSWE